MSKFLGVLFVIIFWYNIIAFVILDIDFTEWNWVERAILVILSMGSISILLQNETPK
jgi:hypothetical protein